MEDGTPAAGAHGTPYMLIRQHNGKFAVAQGNHYCIDGTTKTACLQWARNAVNSRLEREAHAAALQAALLERCTARGIAPIDYRQLQPGDLFTRHADDTIRTVTEVEHLNSGATMIRWEPRRLERACNSWTMMIPGHPECYGRIHAAGPVTA